MNEFGEGPKVWSLNPDSQETSDRGASTKNFGSSMNAISFGFVATAILISLFLIMAIFEHLLRPRSALFRSQNGTRRSSDVGQARPQMHSFQKVKNSQAVKVPNQSDLSVVMPGQQYPTFLAQPAPLPCEREGIQWPSHDHHTVRH